MQKLNEQEVLNEYESAMFAANEAGYAGMTAEQVIRNLIQRAEAAEARVAEMEKQEYSAVVLGPPTYWDQNGGKLRYTIESESALNHGAKLFTRPAPAVNLAELVPDESALADRHIEWLETLQRPMFSDEDWEELTLYTWLAFRDSYRVHRADILRNIEEAQKK